MENIPCPKTLGCPAACAAGSSWCIGLKSPDAPAYFTRSVLVSFVGEDRSLVAHRHLVEDSLCSPTVRIPSTSCVVHLRASFICVRRSSACVGAGGQARTIRLLRTVATGWPVFSSFQFISLTTKVIVLPLDSFW